MSAEPALPGRLLPIIERLREQTGASRTTVRGRAGDDAAALLAESLAPGVPSMAPAQRPDMPAAATYSTVARTRAILVQNDCRTDPPLPPQWFVEDFRVYAQMIAPVLSGEEMIGVISVHQQDSARQWTPADVAALEAARVDVAVVLADRV